MKALMRWGLLGFDTRMIIAVALSGALALGCAGAPQALAAAYLALLDWVAAGDAAGDS